MIDRDTALRALSLILTNNAGNKLSLELIHGIIMVFDQQINTQTSTPNATESVSIDSSGHD